ncbi:DoxX family protein [Nonomuraea sp. NPDC050556]|uniref:DoxX family protein n=1 Tax=Nonomuraea sp. NPDC050556 TaxID=3364369 RepID=UPI003799DFCD
MTAYLIVIMINVVLLAFTAVLNFIRFQPILGNMDRLGVPRGWLPALGLLKLAGAAGLLAGLVAPPLGLAAAVCVVLFFAGAVFTHLRLPAPTLDVLFPGTLFALAVATLVLHVTSS